MRYNCTLNLEHFSDPAFAALTRHIFPHLAAAYIDYPKGNEAAKVWEITQAVRGLADFGALRPGAEILGVAAGYEHTVFYLTNFVRRVFSTDLYEVDGLWKEANAAMLVNPARFATPGMTWKPNRLVVQHMDALDLRYEDESFDGIFSSGSIEHFGTLDNVARAAAEMSRVLKPGGVLVLSTEFRIHGPDSQIGIPGAILFTDAMLLEQIVAASGLDLADNPDFSVSESTSSCAYPLAEVLRSGIRPRSIALTHDDFAWTSVSLCLIKRSPTGAGHVAPTARPATEPE